MTDCCSEHVDAYLIVAAIIFAFLSLMLYLRLHRVKAHTEAVRQEPLPDEIQKAAQDLALQSRKLRIGLNRIARDPNPMEAFIEAVCGREDRNGNDTRDR